jgi:hypothetical protein
VATIARSSRGWRQAATLCHPPATLSFAARMGQTDPTLEKSRGGGMIAIRRLVLDILKPHHPSILEFSKLLASQGDYRVGIKVVEMDDQTQTLEVWIEGANLDFERIQDSISDFGASLHSVDQVEVESQPEPGADS